MLERSYALWQELEATSERRLLRVTGGLMIGRAEGELVVGAQRSAEAYEIAHEGSRRRPPSARRWPSSPSTAARG